MNIANTILILFIIFIIINNLTNKNILNTIINYFNNLKKYFIKSEIKDSNNTFDTILSKMIVKTNKPSNNLNYDVASKSMIKILEKKLLKVLNNHFNKYNFKFYKLTINENFEYSKSVDGKYIKPFNFSVKLYYKNKKIDDLNCKIELFVKKNTNELIVLDLHKDNIATDILTEAHDENNYDQQPNYQTNYQEPEVQINNNFNSLFINSNNNENIESDNNSSLIPSVAEIDLTDIDNSDNNNSSYSTSNS
jgi:hypothetical protein